VPSYPSPERAVLALARAIRYAQWRQAPQGEFRRPADIRAEQARALTETFASAVDDVRLLTDEESAQLLGCYGIDLRPASDTESTVDVVTPAGEVPCVIGVQEDPSFGSLVYFGLSGMVSDLLGDRAYGAVPLTDADAARLVRAPRAAPLLAGYRGAQPVDLGALEDLVSRVATLAEDLPTVRMLALDPVLAGPKGAQVTGARIMVGSPSRRADDEPRQLWTFGASD
jgi:acyl-CoA synthetase (NDP forming)